MQWRIPSRRISPQTARGERPVQAKANYGPGAICAPLRLGPAKLEYDDGDDGDDISYIMTIVIQS